jgi:hypothetical protein
MKLNLISLNLRAFAVAILISSALSSNVIQANDDFDEVEDEVASLVQNFDSESLVEISNRLLKMASEEESNRDYYNAVKHYRQGLLLREKLNMKSNKSYANILLLTSMTEHNFGASCDAKEHAEKAIEIYRKLNHEKEAAIAESENKNYKNSCMVQLSLN